MKFALGQSVPRTEDPRLLTGRGRYTDDFVLPRLAHGYVLRSPHAHARIRSLDIRAAQQMPGVLAVLTGADWAAEKFGALACRSFRASAATARRCSCRRARRWRTTARCWSAIRSPSSSPRASISPRTRPSGSPSITSRCRRSRRPRRRARPSAPQAVGECRRQRMLLLHRSATSARSRPLSPGPITSRALKLVFNRITAATMEPRGCVGDWDDRLEPLHALCRHAAPAWRSRRPGAPECSTCPRPSSASSPAMSAAASA